MGPPIQTSASIAGPSTWALSLGRAGANPNALSLYSRRELGKSQGLLCIVSVCDELRGLPPKSTSQPKTVVLSSVCKSR